MFLNTLHLFNCQSNDIAFKKAITYITISGKKVTNNLENYSYKVLKQFNQITNCIVSCSIDDVCIIVQIDQNQRNCLFFKVNSTLLLSFTNTIQDPTSTLYIKSGTFI